MLNVFFLMVQFEYKGDDMTSVWVKFNNCNKYDKSQISEIALKDIIPVFTKAVVFHHVGPSCMIQTNEQIDFPVGYIFLVDINMGHGII